MKTASTELVALLDSQQFLVADLFTIELPYFLSVYTVGGDYPPAPLIQWSETSAAQNNEWNNVAYGNGMFVAVGWNYSFSGPVYDNFMYSLDGETWTNGVGPQYDEYFVGPTVSLPSGVAYGNGVWVAVVWNGPANDLVVNSPDGINWYNVPNYLGVSPWTPLNNYPDFYGWSCVEFDNGIFMAGSVGKVQSSWIGIMTSTDGYHWTGRTISTDCEVLGIAYGGGTWVAVGQWDVNGPIIYSTDNGVTWSTATIVAGKHLIDVAYGNGMFIAISQDGSPDDIYVSVDGISWTTVSSPHDSAWLRIAFGGGRFVAIATDTPATNSMASSDGTTWTLQPMTIADVYGIAYGEGKFVAVGQQLEQQVGVLL